MGECVRTLCVAAPQVDSGQLVTFVNLLHRADVYAILQAFYSGYHDMIVEAMIVRGVHI